MIQELAAIAAITQSPDIDREDEDGISPAYVADLEFRLRRANTQVQGLLRTMRVEAAPKADEVSSVVNQLDSGLRSMSSDQAYAFMERNFRPEFFEDEDLHPVLGSAIKAALVKYCRESGIKPIYSIWSAT